MYVYLLKVIKAVIFLRALLIVYLVIFIYFFLPGYDSYGIPDQDRFRTCCPAMQREHICSPDPEGFSVHRQGWKRPGTQTRAHKAHGECVECRLNLSNMLLLVHSKTIYNKFLTSFANSQSQPWKIDELLTTESVFSQQAFCHMLVDLQILLRVQSLGYNYDGVNMLLYINVSCKSVALLVT